MFIVKKNFFVFNEENYYNHLDNCCLTVIDFSSCWFDCYSLIMQCSLVYNPCAVPSDVLDSMPIKDTSFGSNITYDPSFEKYVSLSNGTFNNFTFSFRDQNLNEIYARDPNVSITLIIRQKK